MPFPTRAEYELLIYSLPQSQPGDVKSSTLRLYSTSARTARLQGEIAFVSGLELRVREFLDFKLGRILDYSYTVLLGEERVRWYDPQPHPAQLELAATFPHHRHEPPDIKHNRQPAPGITFDAPNLPTLIADCVELAKAFKLAAANDE